MTINTVFEQVKNYIAPEVKVEQTISLGNVAKNRFDLINDLADAFGLELLKDHGDNCCFRFPGSPIVALSQIKVLWGATPDEAPYHGLQAFVEIEWLNEESVQIKLYEDFIGSRAEQRVYHHVLIQRLEKMVNFLRSEHSLEL